MIQDLSHKVVVFTDIKGYTALAERSISDATKWLKIKFDTLERIIEQFNGEIVNEAGDGAMLFFDGFIDAVNFCIELQAIMRSEEVPVRIGIHSGHVGKDENGRWAASAINLASRIEPIGDENTVLVTQPVYQNIKNKEDRNGELFECHFYKTISPKGVDDNINVYYMQGHGLGIPTEYVDEASLSIYKWSIASTSRSIVSGIGVIALGIFFVLIYKWISGTASTAENIDSGVEKVNWFFISVTVLNAAISVFGIYILWKTKVDYNPSELDESDASVSERRSSIAKRIGIREIELGKYYRRAQKGIREFKDVWMCMWFTYIFLYVFLVLDKQLGFELGVLVRFCNNLSSILLLMCVSILSDRLENDDHTSQIKPSTFFFGFTAIGLLTGIDLFYYAIEPENILDIQKNIKIFGGIFSGLAFGLLVGRLDSKLLNVPKPILVVLFGYAAIQPLFAYLDEGSALSLTLINYALVGKATIILVVAWLIHTKRLLFFFLKMNRIIQEIDQEWKKIQKDI